MRVLSGEREGERGEKWEEREKGLWWGESFEIDERE